VSGGNGLDIVERWGRIFKRAKDGLDEEQVASFVNELIRERDTLVKQGEYLFSLIRLLERMVGETGTINQNHREVIDQAKEQTRQVKGEQVVEEKKPETKTMPTREAEATKTDAQHRLQELIGAAGQAQTDEPEPQWEVHILPPIDIMQALGVMTSLDSLPEIEKTELIPDINKPLITVFVRKPIHLIDALRKLPQVAEVRGDGVDGAGTNGKPRKVQIVLSQKATSERGK
jgi:hypothetical protein